MGIPIFDLEAFNRQATIERGSACKRVESFWYLPLEQELEDEFPYRNRRISLEQLRKARQLIISGSCCMGSSGIQGNLFDEHYLHKSGIFVSFYTDDYFTNSTREEMERHQSRLLDNHSELKEMYVLKLVAPRCDSDKIRKLELSVGLTSSDK